MKSKDLKKQLDKDNLHHAHLIVGAREGVLSELESFFTNELEIEVKSNPDYFVKEFDTFGIDDSRGLKQMQSRSAVNGFKIFVILANSFTHEAQNSLLKIFEEPTAGTLFFIITQNTETILPTLKSRLLILSPRFNLDESEEVVGVDIEAFLKASRSKRLEFLKDIIENKDKQLAVSFLNNLESALYNQLGTSYTKLTEGVFVFGEIRKARSYLNDRSPSVKMLMEHIAMIV